MVWHNGEFNSCVAATFHQCTYHHFSSCTQHLRLQAGLSSPMFDELRMEQLGISGGCGTPRRFGTCEWANWFYGDCHIQNLQNNKLMIMLNGFSKELIGFVGHSERGALLGAVGSFSARQWGWLGMVRGWSSLLAGRAAIGSTIWCGSAGRSSIQCE